VIEAPHNLIGETPLSLSQAARRLPPGRRDRPVTLSCLVRWIMNGLAGPDGQRVRLEAVRLGGRWITSEQALARFAAALTPRLGDKPVSYLRTPKQRERAAARAAKRLEEVGI
jgi:hypothetical protein